MHHTHHKSWWKSIHHVIWLRNYFIETAAQMFYKIGVLTNFAILTGKHLCWNLIVAGQKECNCIKKQLQNGFFSVNMAKFLKGRIHCEIFIVSISWNCERFRIISWNMKYIHKILLLKYPAFIVYVQKQPSEVFCKKRCS